MRDRVHHERAHDDADWLHRDHPERRGLELLDDPSGSSHSLTTAVTLAATGAPVVAVAAQPRQEQAALRIPEAVPATR